MARLEEQGEEGGVVPCTDAVAQQVAMVVKADDAVVASSTVVRVLAVAHAAVGAAYLARVTIASA